MKKATGMELLPLLNQMYKCKIINSEQRDEFAALTRKGILVNPQFYHPLFIKLNALSKVDGRTPYELTLLNRAVQLLENTNQM